MKFMITIGATAQGWKQGKVPIIIAQSKVKITKAKKKKKKEEVSISYTQFMCQTLFFFFLLS